MSRGPTTLKSPQHYCATLALAFFGFVLTIPVAHAEQSYSSVNWMLLIDRMRACYQLALAGPTRDRVQADMRHNNDLIDCGNDDACKRKADKTYQDTLNEIQKDQNIMTAHYQKYTADVQACAAADNLCKAPNFNPTTASCAVVGNYASDLDDTLTE